MSEAEREQILAAMDRSDEAFGSEAGPDEYYWIMLSSGRPPLVCSGPVPQTSGINI